MMCAWHDLIIEHRKCDYLLMHALSIFLQCMYILHAVRVPLMHNILVTRIYIIKFELLHYSILLCTYFVFFSPRLKA